MWRGLRLRLHATSHWHCSGAAMTLARAGLRVGLGKEWGEMYVKIMCLQDALYKAIKLSVSKTVHRGYNLCLWQPKIHFSCLFHCELHHRVVSFVGALGKKKILILYSSLKLLKGRHKGFKWSFHSGNETIGVLILNVLNIEFTSMLKRCIHRRWGGMATIGIIKDYYT